MDEYELELLNMSQEEMERIANGEDDTRPLDDKGGESLT